MTNQIDSPLPLTESTFFILLSLAPGAKHGYAIVKDIRTLSDERIQLSTGTLYGALDRMLDLAWIERCDKPDDPDQTGHRLRKYYRLTTLGQRILNAETKRMSTLVSLARLNTAIE